MVRVTQSTGKWKTKKKDKKNPRPHWNKFFVFTLVRDA